MTESFNNAGFKWNNHSSVLMEHFYCMLERDEFVDVTISSGGKSINVHRLVLAASSHYFEVRYLYLLIKILVIVY